MVQVAAVGMPEAKGIQVVRKPDADQAPGIFKLRTYGLPFTDIIHAITIKLQSLHLPSDDLQ